MTSPLVIRFCDGREQVVAHCFPHPQGLLYLDLFWHLSTPDKAAHVVDGSLVGEGPWKVGDAVIRVLGCRNTDPHLQDEYLRWKSYLEKQLDQYPAQQQIRNIALQLGARLEPDQTDG